MKYLVTGGLGVIGSFFARRMLEGGHQVVIIDSCEEPRNEWIGAGMIGDAPDASLLSIERVRLERGYESRISDLYGLVSSVDAVLHAAAHTGIPHSINNPDDDWASNVDATRILLEALRSHPKPTVVLSSVKPYRVSPGLNEGRGLNEFDLLEPDEPYAASKAAQSMLCQAYARSYGLPIVTFRCSNLYGPAPCHGPRHGWLTWFCISAAIGRPLEVQGTGEQSRDMLHAGDVASAALKAFERHLQPSVGGQIFNLGGGMANVVTVGEVARLLQELTGVEVRSAPARAMDDDRVYVDHTKFSIATGWRPRVEVAEGIRTTLAWAQRNKAALAKLYEGV